jgi:hypothetical protein
MLNRATGYQALQERLRMMGEEASMSSVTCSGAAYRRRILTKSLDQAYVKAATTHFGDNALRSGRFSRPKSSVIACHGFGHTMLYFNGRD